jgi:hypothetical protein
MRNLLKVTAISELLVNYPANPQQFPVYADLSHPKMKRNPLSLSASSPLRTLQWDRHTQTVIPVADLQPIPQKLAKLGRTSDLPQAGLANGIQRPYFGNLAKRSCAGAHPPSAAFFQTLTMSRCKGLSARPSRSVSWKFESAGDTKSGRRTDVAE